MKSNDLKNALNTIRIRDDMEQRLVDRCTHFANTDADIHSANRYGRHIRKLAVSFAVIGIFVVGMLTVNAAMDLTPLFEPILGERAAKFVQGIHEMDEKNGILLSVDAGYVDDHDAIIFFTLTDIEGLGRMCADASDDLSERIKNVPKIPNFDFSPDLWLYSSSYGVGDIDVSPDGQSVQYRLDYHTDGGNLQGKLLRLNVSFADDPNGRQSAFSLNASFRLRSENFKRQVSVNIDFSGHHIDLVTITRLGIEFAGTRDMSSPIGAPTENAPFPDSAVTFLTSDGQPIELWNCGTSGASYNYDNNSGFTFTRHYAGIIPDDLAAMRLDGMEYSLVGE